MAEYDVFLSHNSADRVAVEELARRLVKANIRPWLDKWNLIPGEPWQEAIEEALDACQTVAVFLGPTGIGPWENEEMRSALEERVRDKSRRTIPALLPGAPESQKRPLPRFLRRLTWVDFRRGLDDAEAWHLLISGIKGVPPGPGQAIYEEDLEAAKEPSVPFVGPIPFRSSDTSIFFGRTRCLDKIFDKLVKGNYPLLVINGLSGVGKTSLLRAGLCPQLQEKGYSVAYTSILDSPESDVIRGIRDAFPAVRGSPSVDMLEAVNRNACSQNRPFFLVVDQLERCFTIARDSEEHLRFWRGIALLVRGAARCPVKVVIAVRADWLHAFQTVSPDPLDIDVFSFVFLVERLNTDEAREALAKPLERFNIAYEPELIDTIVNELASRDGYVNPPQLQIVGAELYRHMRESGRGETRLTLQDYNSLHGAGAIIRKHLANTVDYLGPNAQIGWQILLKLVGPENQRINKRAEALRGNLSHQEFSRIVGHLENARLVVRELSSVDKVPVYTLTHDYLIEEISHHFRENRELQAWKTAEQYLDTGLADWRDAKRTTGQELFLERGRYLHIYSQREALGTLTAEADGFLLQTGLYRGESSFSYWLARLPDDHDQAALEIIRDYCLHPDNTIRQATQKAVINAIRENLLTDEHQQRLKDLLWEEFVTPAVEDTTEGKRAEQLSRSDTTQLPKTERKKPAATVLWALRRFANVSEVLRFAPIAAWGWMVSHGTQIIAAVGSALLVAALVLVFWSVREGLRGEWYPTHTLFAGRVSAAALSPDNPNIVYIITPRGPVAGDGASLLWRQGDDEWKILSQSFTNSPVSLLLITRSNGKPRIYVSVRERGILRSDDNGKSWKLINAGLHSYDIRAIVADPLNPDILYAGSGDKRGVFESRDGGDTWEDISEDGMFGVSVLSMVFTPYGSGTLLAGTEDGRIMAHRRSESGWRLASAYPGAGPVVCMSAELEEGKHIYAGTSTGNVLVSSNGGADWIFPRRTLDVFGISSIVVVPGEPNVAYMDAFGIGGYVVWKTEDGGQNWRHVSDDQFTREGMRWLLIHEREPGTLYAAGGAGFFETQDGGDSWIFHRSIGAPLASVNDIAVSPFSDGPTYASVGGAIYSSLNPETGVWKRGDGLLAIHVRDIVPDPDNAATAYAGVYLPNKWSVFTTMDGGETWQSTPPPVDIPERYLNDTMALDIARMDGRTVLYAGTNGCGVFYTTDRGASWESGGRKDCSPSGDAPKNVLDLAIDPRSADTLYVAAESSRVFITEGRGRSWQSYPTPLTTEIIAIEVDPEIEGRVYLIAGSDGFWRSDDGAKTWERYSMGLEEKSLSSMAIIPGMAETLFVGAISGEVWKTVDGGQHWTPVRENLAVTNISTLASGILKGTIWLGGNDGLYRYEPGTLIGLR